MNTQVEKWLERDPDNTTREELKSLINQERWSEIEQRFSSRLQFGTAGLRGEVGAGPNRMNRLVIQETALGLGTYLLESTPNAAEQGIIIGYDGRLLSKQFAYDTASVMLALGIKVYLSHKVSPTPTIAFGITHLNTAAGVVVTASHNPPQDNGFKVYWDNGAQIISPHDSGIAKAIDLASVAPIPLSDLAQAESNEQLVWLDEQFFTDYQVMVLSDSSPKNRTTAFKAAYTPMHGVGADIAEQLIQDQGLCELHTVASQREPDGHFPTVNFPNPEEPGAMDLVIELANQIDAEFAIANDPDADRFAIAVRTPTNDFKMLTGDQVGVLLANHLLSKSQANVWVGNTIVSSRLLEKVATSYGASYYQTLTGFKWLANIAMSKRSDSKPFLFAYEEALGYAAGEKVWDKDGLSALVIFIELIDKLKSQNMTIWDQLAALYQQHGLHTTVQKSLRLAAGSPSVGERLRQQPPSTIAQQNVTAILDYKTSQVTYQDGTTSTIDLPQSDVLVYVLEDQTRIIVRPSGTEPKLKCYYEQITSYNTENDFWIEEQQAQTQLASLIDQHQASIQALLN
ncbi:phospho-sugar mutase [Vibrio sp. RC27]